MVFFSWYWTSLNAASSPCTGHKNFLHLCAIEFPWSQSLPSHLITHRAQKLLDSEKRAELELKGQGRKDAYELPFFSNLFQKLSLWLYIDIFGYNSDPQKNA